MTDEILAKNATNIPQIDPSQRISWVKQKWNESKAKGNTIPYYIRTMIETLRKYNIGIEAIQMDPKLAGSFPISHHFAAEDQYLRNKVAARCLRDNHKATTVSQTWELSLRMWTEDDQCADTWWACRTMANQLI